MTIAQDQDDNPLDPFFIFAVIFLVAPLAAHVAFLLIAIARGFVGDGLSFAAIASFYGIPCAAIAGFPAAVRFHRSLKIDLVSFVLCWALQSCLIFAFYPFARWLFIWHLWLALSLAIGLGISWLLIIAARPFLRRHALRWAARILILVVLSIPAAAFCWSLIWSFFFQHNEAAVRLPIGSNAVAYVQEWVRWDAIDGHFWLVVKTPEGEVTTKMWEDWGPARSANLYVTPENTLVVIGAGGVDTFVRFVGEKPELGAGPVSASEHWIYLGAVAPGGKDWRELKFYSADTHRECVDLFGAGASPYRKQFQKNSC
jgi:hypothetical protein